MPHTWPPEEAADKEDDHVWKKAKTKRTIVPTNWKVPIQQTITNLFDRGTWGVLSEAETNTKPQPTTTKDVAIPFFQERHEQASVTLFDLCGRKDMYGGAMKD